jgi:hypothetical protein
MPPSSLDLNQPSKKQPEAGSNQSCSTLKMEVIYSLETSVDFQRSTRRYTFLALITPEDCYKCVFFAFSVTKF